MTLTLPNLTVGGLTTLDLHHSLELGEGGTALISRVIFQGQFVALKTFKGRSRKHRVAAEREIDILSHVRHDNLISLIAVEDFGGMPALILELCGGGDLFTLLHKSAMELSWTHQLKIIGDIAKGMNFLHEHEPMIMHRDVKSLNLLLSSPHSNKSSPCIKVSDFGSCRTRDCDEGAGWSWSTLTRQVGTHPWMAPEVPSGAYDHKADVFSFGMVMFEVFAQEIPFEGLEASSIPALVLRGERPDLDAVPPEVSDEMLELMLWAWLDDPTKRPSFATILHVTSACEDM